MGIKRTIFPVIMLTVCITFFILIFTEMHEKSTSQGIRKNYISGVIDRFEENHAVIILDGLNKQISLPKQRVPVGMKENIWLYIVNQNGEYKIACINYKKTKQEWMKTQLLMEKLRE
ncbi:DUF3006 domain-containing protein [Oceanobacillus bengalensis]|nr:DUF3006 domain-containing protein [Oceanobacillus bengalensis]